MISIRVRNFRGCASAEIELDPIALVAGRNGAGKSSLAQATGAVLTGETLPFGLATKGSAAALVKSAAQEAIVYLKGDNGMSHIEWPACAVTSDGDPPGASAYAAGLASIALLPPKERAQVLGQYLRADPTREDLASALADVELGDDHVVTAVWKIIEDYGWDGAHSLRRDKGVELKGAWRQVTTQNYGSRIGVTWAPAGWTLDLDGMTEADLEAAVEMARAEHERAIGAAAVSAAAREQMAAEAGELDAREDSLRDAEKAAEELADMLDKAKEERTTLPPGNVEPGLPCPHCGAFVVVRQVDLDGTRVLEPAEVAPVTPAWGIEQRRLLAIADADGSDWQFDGVRCATPIARSGSGARLHAAGTAGASPTGLKRCRRRGADGIGPRPRAAHDRSAMRRLAGLAAKARCRRPAAEDRRQRSCALGSSRRTGCARRNWPASSNCSTWRSSASLASRPAGTRSRSMRK